MADDYFDMKLAVNQQTGAPVAGAEAQVFAMQDTAFANPLPITDMQGIPMAKLVASPTGVYPPFKVASGETQVIAVSGAAITPITSLFGQLLALIPNPAGQADQLTIVTQSGGFVLAPAAMTPIPDATLGDDGQVLAIVDGVWAITDPTGGSGGTIGGILDGGAP